MFKHLPNHTIGKRGGVFTRFAFVSGGMLPSIVDQVTKMQAVQPPQPSSAESHQQQQSTSGKTPPNPTAATNAPAGQASDGDWPDRRTVSRTGKGQRSIDCHPNYKLLSYKMHTVRAPKAAERTSLSARRSVEWQGFVHIWPNRFGTGSVGNSTSYFIRTWCTQRRRQQKITTIEMLHS